MNTSKQGTINAILIIFVFMISLIFDKYYNENEKARNILLTHSRMVCDKALSIVQAHPELNADVETIKLGSMLHDIGIIKTNAPKIFCYGLHPYICHGVLGREILESEGLHELALISERHTGAGLSKEEIIQQNLPLPHRDMLPKSIEEKIICFADKFYSKSGEPTKEKSLKKIRKDMAKYGQAQLERFNILCELFL